MKVALPLSKMTRIDKVRTMEVLWDDLCKEPDALSSPAWHKGVLEARGKRLGAGVEKVHDWETAKERIRRSV